MADVTRNKDLTLHLPLLWRLANELSDRVGDVTPEEVLGDVYVACERLMRAYTPERGTVSTYLLRYGRHHALRTHLAARGDHDAGSYDAAGRNLGRRRRIEPTDAAALSQAVYAQPEAEPVERLPQCYLDLVTPRQWGALRLYCEGADGRTMVGALKPGGTRNNGYLAVREGLHKLRTAANGGIKPCQTKHSKSATPSTRYSSGALRAA